MIPVCSVFKHGLDPDFMEKLEILAKRPGWFADVLADPGLVLGIRDNYINVYWRGCSLFKIWEGKTGCLKFSTHPKYLVDPDLSKQVEFDGSDFKVTELTALISHYRGSETLDKMRRAAKNYCGDEKEGVHAVICAGENNVIDTEITFEGNLSKAIQKIDLACLEEVQGSIRLRFWEAKLYKNDEIHAAGENEPPVVNQVSCYRAKLIEHRDEVIESYRVVARNLVDIARWVGIPGKSGKLIGRVAAGDPVVLDDTPFVGLIVYGFDADQKHGDRWAKDRKKLERKMYVVAKGDPKGIKLRGGPHPPQSQGWEGA